MRADKKRTKNQFHEARFGLFRHDRGNRPSALLSSKVTWIHPSGHLGWPEDLQERNYVFMPWAWLSPCWHRSPSAPNFFGFSPTSRAFANPCSTRWVTQSTWAVEHTAPRVCRPGPGIPRSIAESWISAPHSGHPFVFSLPMSLSEMPAQTGLDLSGTFRDISRMCSWCWVCCILLNY